MMVTITLYKALKLKKRLAGRLAQTNQDIRIYNSVLASKFGEVNVSELFDQRTALINALVELKVILEQCSVDVKSEMIQLAELKSENDFLRGLNTRHGKETHDYQNTEVEYTAFYKKADVDKQVKNNERTIDEVQDELDKYNNTHTMQIPQTTIDLAS